MSSAVKVVQKAFRPIKDLANKVTGGAVSRVGNSIWNNKIARVAIIAAATWYTAGVASAYFAAPSAGLGSAMSASGTAMWQTATTGTFVSGANVATGASAATGSQASMLAAQNAGLGAEATATTNSALGTATAANAGVDTVGGLTAKAGSEGIIAGAANGGNAVLDGAGKVAAKEGLSPTMKFAATMMAGNALQGAMASKDAQRERDRQENIRQSRGTYGYNYQGDSAGGIVKNSMQAPQQVQSQGAQRVRQVSVNDLPELRRQGLVNNNRRS